MANRVLEAVEKLGGTLPTLKAISMVMDIPYTRIHAVSKQPKEGEVYDRNIFNWDAVDRFIERRLDPDKGFATTEDLIKAALEADEQLKQEDGRHTATVGNKVITLSDGTQVAARKYDYPVGSKVIIKKDEKNAIYNVVFSTVSHLVLQPEGTEELILMSNNTANWRLVPPALFESTLKQRAEAATKAVESVQA